MDTGARAAGAVSQPTSEPASTAAALPSGAPRPLLEDPLGLANGVFGAVNVFEVARFGWLLDMLVKDQQGPVLTGVWIMDVFQDGNGEVVSGGCVHGRVVADHADDWLDGGAEAPQTQPAEFGAAPPGVCGGTSVTRDRVDSIFFVHVSPPSLLLYEIDFSFY